MTRVRSPLPTTVPSSGDWMHDRLTEARGILADSNQHSASLVIIAARDPRPLHAVATADVKNGGGA